MSHTAQDGQKISCVHAIHPKRLCIECHVHNWDKEAIREEEAHREQLQEALCPEVTTTEGLQPAAWGGEKYCGRQVLLWRGVVALRCCGNEVWWWEGEEVKYCDGDALQCRGNMVRRYCGRDEV